MLIGPALVIVIFLPKFFIDQKKFHRWQHAVQMREYAPKELEHSGSALTEAGGGIPVQAEESVELQMGAYLISRRYLVSFIDYCFPCLLVALHGRIDQYP